MLKLKLANNVTRCKVQRIIPSTPIVQGIGSHHLYSPEQRESKAGMHTSGSKAARKSPFVGTPSSLDFTTSKYDAPQNMTRTTIKKEKRLSRPTSGRTIKYKPLVPRT